MSRPATYLDYLIPMSYSLWRWDDNFEFIASNKGRSVCHFEELLSLLGAMRTLGWPTLDVVLVLMEVAGTREIGLEKENELVESAGALLFLRRFNRWVKQFRENLQGQFSKEEIILRLASIIPQKDQSATTFHPHFHFPQLRKSSALDEPFDYERPTVLPGDEAIDLLGQTFLDYASFERFLLSGFEQLPSAKDLDSALEALPEATDDSQGLFEELSQKPETVGIAQMALALLAFMKLPIHLDKFGDQALGGVSDISNRGSLDRLLISELAQDDLILSARLANQEALYLRKESPPEEDKRSRNILLDTSIPMWGTPRTIGLAACLAAALMKRPTETQQFVALKGQGFGKYSLLSRPGMAAFLKSMSSELHCGNALHAFFKEKENIAASNLLITCAENLQDQEFANFLLPCQINLDFLLSIHRDGSLELFQMKSGHRRSIRKAKLDATSLMQARRQGSKTGWVGKEFQEEYPLFCLASTLLRFPKPNSSPSNKESEYLLKNHELLLLTRDRRLLFWSDTSKGAEELLNDIPEGNEILYDNGRKELALFLQPQKPNTEALLYYLNIHEKWSTSCHLGPLRIYASDICLNEGEILFNASNDQPLTKEYHWTQEAGCQPTGLTASSGTKKDVPVCSRTKLKQRLKRSGSTFSNYNSCSITAEGNLMVGDKVLHADPGPSSTSLNWRPLENASLETLRMTLRFPKYAREETRKGDLRYIRTAQSADGSLIFADKRGFLHLRSSNGQLAEVTIVTLLGAPTAAWASDGCLTGDPYFFQEGWQTYDHRLLNPLEFFNTYIQPIISEMRMP